MPRELVAGSKAPSFSLPRDDGTEVSLLDFKGRNLVLYFYPKADTPGCTKEAIAFSGLRAAFARADTENSRSLGRFGKGTGQIQIQASVEDRARVR